MGGTFLKAAANQGRVLAAIVMIEFAQRSSRRSLGILEEVFSLMILVIGFMGLRVLVKAPTHYGMPALPFLLSGMLLFWLFRLTASRLMGLKGVKGPYRGMPRVTQLDVVLGRAFIDFLVYTSIAVTVFSILVATGLSPWVERPWTLLLLFMLASLWGVGLGLCFGYIVLIAPFLRMLITGMMLGMMWISGIFFIWPEVLYSMRWIFARNPVFHMMELARDAYFESYETPIGDWTYFLAWVFITLAIGLMLERISRPLSSQNSLRKQEDENPFAHGPI